MRPRTVIWTSAFTALLVALSTWLIGSASATLLANQTNYRRTGNNPFASGAALTQTDLNNNFDALVTVVDGNIDRTNMPTSVGSVIPRAWAVVRTQCTASPCTMADNQGFSSITRSAAGTYAATLSASRADTNYAAIVNSGVGPADVFCHGESSTAAVIDIACDDVAGVNTDADFSIVVFDN